MLLQKKFISFCIWTLLAFSIGIGISYITIKGGEIAFGAIYDKTQELLSRAPIAQNTPIPSPNVKDLGATLGEPPDIPIIDNNISIGFVGDIVPEIEASDNIFSDVILYTERPDIMIGNFEGVATNNVYLKCKLDAINCYSFNGDNNFLELLSAASFDVLNIANNHFNDYGKIGQEVTLEEIMNAGITASGTKDEVTFLVKNDLTIGIIGFSTYTWTTNMNDTENLERIIEVTGESADIVIVIFHGGGEGPDYAHTTNETEWYLGQNRGNLRSFAYNAIDAGADIVLGSGPHVLRGIEWYKDKLIAYSLGNFVALNSLSRIGSLKTSAMIEVTFRKDGSLVSGSIFPFEIDRSGIPHPDLNNRAISTINDLSKADFGEQGVVLDSDGKIQIK